MHYIVHESAGHDTHLMVAQGGLQTPVSFHRPPVGGQDLSDQRQHCQVAPARHRAYQLPFLQHQLVRDDEGTAWWIGSLNPDALEHPRGRK